MPDCGFEDQLSSGVKAGILGLIIGAMLWLTMGEKKHGSLGYPRAKTAAELRAEAAAKAADAAK
jgi:hypothetical protein